MLSALIVGSGPAAAGAALALSRAGRRQGHRRRCRRASRGRQAGLRRRSGRCSTQAWAQTAIEAIGAISPRSDDRCPATESNRCASARNGPTGRISRSATSGQLTGVTALGRANGAVISGAYGGFSNVWGAQVMPFTSASFDTWPVSWSDMEPHYRSVLSHIPFAADGDDLADLFPLVADAAPLPTLAPRSAMVLDAYAAPP